MKRSHWVSKSRSLHSPFSLCGAKSMPFPALGSRWEIVRMLSFPTRRPERKERWPGSKVTPEMPWSPGDQCVLCKDHCAAGHSTLASHWKLQDRLPTQTNPALILLLQFLLLRKRDQDHEPHPEMLWAAAAACWCLLRSRRPRSSCPHCSSTGFCRSNTRAASLPAQSLVSSQPTCQCQTKPVVCSMEFSPELFQIWQSRNVSKLYGSLQENSMLINFRCYFLAQ